MSRPCGPIWLRSSADQGDPGIEHVALTTNALRLGKLAQPLKDAGLDRVNVSIDTLDPQRFRQITRGGKLELVWEGIAAADQVGLHPIKLNAVVVRGLNDDEVPQLAALTLTYPWEMRFIEVMLLSRRGRCGRRWCGEERGADRPAYGDPRPARRSGAGA